MRPPRWTLRQGWGGLRVGRGFLPPAAHSRAGRVLQTLVGAQESFAVGTVMVHVLQGVHAERNEAAARDAPGRQTTAHVEQVSAWSSLAGGDQKDTSGILVPPEPVSGTLFRGRVVADTINLEMKS